MQPSTPTEAKRDPWFRNHLIRDAIGQALYEEMKRDPAIHLFGEGAHMKVHFDALRIEAELPDRVHTLPISEDSNTNFAVGASLVGLKPVVDVITADFLYRTMDSISNTAAKLNFVSPGETPKTIVIRSEFLIGGPSTGQRPEALFVHIPGLNVVIPSTPRDAYGLMRTALNIPGVTLFFEDRMIKDSETKEEDTVLHGPVGLGQARRRKGTLGRPQATIVTYGLARQIVEGILDQYQELKVLLIDLRTLYPLDWDTVLEAARISDKLVIVEPDVVYAGVGAEIAATVAERLPGTVIRRVGAPRSTIPASPSLHDRMLPTEEDIRDAIKSF